MNSGSNRKKGEDSCASEFSEASMDSESNRTDGEREEEENEDEPFLEPGAICKEHELKIHSWNKKNRALLCTMCIQGANLPNEQVKVFP